MKTRMVLPPLVLAATAGLAALSPSLSPGSRALAADPPRLLARGLFSGARPILGRAEPDEPPSTAPTREANRDTPSSRFGQLDRSPSPASGSTATRTTSARPSPTPVEVPVAAGKVKTTEEAARRVGVSVDELRRLRSLGYLDSEVETLVKKGNRHPRDLILEREVLNAMGKEIDTINARVWQLNKPKRELEEERDRELRVALGRVAKTYHAGRDDMRRILTGTSFLTPDQIRRHLGGGPSLFSTDSLRRVSLFGGQ